MKSQMFETEKIIRIIDPMNHYRHNFYCSDKIKKTDDLPTAEFKIQS